MKRKPSDWHAIPLCAHHHRECHRGERAFYEKHTIMAHDDAAIFYKLSPHKHQGKMGMK